jgi:AcrR family transcriptional regulator
VRTYTPIVATQAERREATRRRLIDVARECFAVDGYDQTSTDHIREQAGVSRGAMYHYFPSKRDIFEAVFREVSNETIQRAIRHDESGGSPLHDLTAACVAWLREVQDPHAAAILLDQGPHVLGWKRARDVEAGTSLGLMVRALEQAAAVGEIDVISVPLTAKLLNAILAEAALVAINETSATSSVELEQAVRQFIDGLTPRPERPESPNPTP